MKKFIIRLCKVGLIRKIVIKIIASNEVKQSKSKILREIYSKYYNINIGQGTYGGCFNYNNINRNITIGKYCSFAKNVYYFNANHPIKEFTTHPIIYNPVFGYVDSERIERSNLVIGNDVWVGNNVTILANVKKIGNGAIIGAGSIVTSDIPDYAVAVGVPAKIISYRFEVESIENLNRLKWWDFSEDKIKSIIDLKMNINELCNSDINSRKNNVR